MTPPGEIHLTCVLCGGTLRVDFGEVEVGDVTVTPSGGLGVKLTSKVETLRSILARHECSSPAA